MYNDIRENKVGTNGETKTQKRVKKSKKDQISERFWELFGNFFGTDGRLPLKMYKMDVKLCIRHKIRRKNTLQKWNFVIFAKSQSRQDTK